jgi:DNA helicase-2/ATP-dependent DNA helicase PcrA
VEEDLLLGRLNDAQREAVTHGEGPCLVVAGAGSGKTRVLTHRAAYLVGRRDVSPENLLAITFTNKAADEMRGRILGLVGEVARDMWISTFHAACARILRRHGELLGYRSGFSIYDQDDATRIVSSVIRDAGLDSKRFSARSVAAAISSAKNRLVSPDDMEEAAVGARERILAGLYRSYQARMLLANAMDFDDLLVLTEKLLANFPELAARYQERFHHVLVDEYQDTNYVQARLLARLAAQYRNLFAVGDSDQSVYGFRGADQRNIAEFERMFPDARVILLEENYRSSQSILDAANALIAHNRHRIPKRLWSRKGGGEEVVYFEAEDDREEAAWVAGRIGDLAGELGYSFGDIAVFYRVNAQSRSIEEQLVARRIPYRVVGAVRFYERKEVRDLLSWLRLIVNQDDEASLRRAISAPRRGVGEASLERIAAHGAAVGVPLGEAVVMAAKGEVPGISGRVEAALVGFLEVLEELRAQVGQLSVADLASEALERSGYLSELAADDPTIAAGRRENLEELIGHASSYGSLEEFLASVSLTSDLDEQEWGSSKVTLMTLHLAKGLEFPVVFLVGLEEGLLPHQRSLDDPEALEEERRLAYVGVTRAKERLYTSAARRRALWGSSQQTLRSRFVAEMGAKELARPSAWSDVERWVAYERSELVRRARERNRPHPPGFGAELAGLAVGEDVVHAKWGEGVVIQVSGEGEHAEAVVNFSSVGQKRLALAWAPLKRLRRTRPL